MVYGAVVSSNMNQLAAYASSSTADVDLLREMARTFAEALASAEVDAVCGAVTEERVNWRDGYYAPDWDPREAQSTWLRSSSYFPGWLLEPPRRAERALVQVVADYLTGVLAWRVDELFLCKDA